MTTQKDAALSFLHLVTSGKIREAYTTLLSPGFRHHNPFFSGDAAALMKGMEENEAKFPNKSLRVHHLVEEGDLVAAYSYVSLKPNGPDIAVMHVFRFAGDKIVELWDIGQPIPVDSPNENGMF